MVDVVIPEFEIVDIADVMPYAQNPREHPTEQIDKLASLIKHYGFLVPIVIDKDGEISAGHGRLLAAHRLNLTRVPVVRAEHLTPAQIKGYRLADNQSALMSDWIPDLLRVELEQLHEQEYDMALTAFETDEITSIIDDYGSQIDEIEPPDLRSGFSEATNFIIKCDTMSEREAVKAWIGTEADSITYEKFKRIIDDKGWV